MQYKLNYKLLSATGVLIDEAENFVFNLGDGSLASELEECVKECELGRLQTFLLRGSEVFGAYDELAKKNIALSALPQDIAIDAAIDFTLPNGDEVIGVVREITENEALIDFNHPLSNIDISFIVEVLAKDESSTC
jgi:FKBP-type peptidyl-prolyl cis-trans isomerase SlpA